jgi:glycosyltransferase involved in cell wall biosynthesis
LSDFDSILPFITVVIPTYNRLALVRQAIASVVAQTFSNWELIVADDGSDDGTPEFIHSLKDPRIRVLEMPHTGNIAVARNRGVRAGAGEWVTFLDSDDLWIPQKLEIQISRMLEEKKRWGYGRFELMDQELQIIPFKAGTFRPISGWIAKEVLTTEASVNIGTVMLERTLFDTAGGFNNDARILYREDYELVLRLSLIAEAVALPDLLLRVREHTGRATNQFKHGHERTAFVYEYFLKSNPEQKLAKIARRRFTTELTEASVQDMRKRNYFQAVRKLGKALVHGNNFRHLLSAVRRGFF